MYSTINTAYLVAYDRDAEFEEEWSWFLVVNTAVEVLFVADIVTRFITSYYDTELARPITKQSKITRNYACGWFIVDLLTIIPFWALFHGGNSVKILRIIRLPKALELFEIDRFEYLMICILAKVYKQSRSSNYASKRTQQISVYFYKIFNLIVYALLFTYFVACFWYFLSDIDLFNYGCDNTFVKLPTINRETGWQKLVATCYFTLTSLSTVGYGDITPQNNFEKIICIFLMIIGIGFFTYIMGNFNDVLLNYDQKMGIVDHGSGLQVWLLSLARFTPNNPLPKTLVTTIDKHFRFYWDNDRLSSIDEDDTYLNLLPHDQRRELMNYIFDDVFQTFRGFFLRKEFFDSNFFYHVSFFQMPSLVKPGQQILKQGEEMNSIYFIMSGEVMIEFDYNCGTPVADEQLLDKNFQKTDTDGALWMKFQRFYGKGYYFGEYACLMDLPCVFHIKATTPVFLYSIPKLKLLSLRDEFPKHVEKIISETEKNYLVKISFLKSVQQEDIKKAHGIDKTEEEIDKIWKTHVTGYADALECQRQKNKEKFLGEEVSPDICVDYEDKDDEVWKLNMEAVKKNRTEFIHISKRIDKLSSILGFELE